MVKQVTNLYQETKRKLQAPTPKKARRERFWSLVVSALSTITAVGTSVVNVGILSSSASKWTMIGIAVVSGVNAFIQQLKTE